MERHIAVAAPVQRLETSFAPRFGADEDASARGRSLACRGERLRRDTRRRGAGLDDEHGVFLVWKRAEERREHLRRALAVLPLEHGVENEVARAQAGNGFVRHVPVEPPRQHSVRQLEDRRPKIALNTETLNSQGSHTSSTWLRTLRHWSGIVSVSHTVMPMALRSGKARRAHCGGMP